MITPEEFQQLVEDLASGVLVSQDRIKGLAETVVELDSQNSVLAGALHFSLDTADQLFLSYGSTIAGIIGIRDLGKKRKIAEAGAAAATQLRGSVQSLILGMVEEAQQIAGADLAVGDADEAGADDETAAGEVVASDE